MTAGRSDAVRWVGAMMVALGVLLGAPHAGAREARQLAPGEPATSRVLQLGVGGVYGVALSPELNPWAFGLGVQVGYTFPAGVYLGLPFDYFFGSKETFGGVESESKLWQVELEGGYDLAVADALVLRGKVGIGVAQPTTRTVSSGTGTGACSAEQCIHGNASQLAFGPGLTFRYLGPSFSFTFDARYELVMTDPASQGLLFSLGFGF